ncbi:hypothetical protein IMSHALPRED_011126 [Imshaugia aleurites]|uniref:Uncharacterized protein n=1 Tax=Imshaugia aleurites TaxID=172621 RepID=A0A8H3IRB6_9LECA|nr:hypothetical protein IMSHALPRED_011126 [Imshaugia aleurites]
MSSANMSSNSMTAAPTMILDIIISTVAPTTTPDINTAAPTTIPGPNSPNKSLLDLVEFYLELFLTAVALLAIFVGVGMSILCIIAGFIDLFRKMRERRARRRAAAAAEASAVELAMVGGTNLGR